MVQQTLTNPNELREHMDFFKRRTQATQTRIEKQLKDADEEMIKIAEAKDRVVDLYASGEIEKNTYITKNLEYDNELNKLKLERTELVKKIPLLHKKQIIDTSMRQYCDGAKVRFEKCIDFETKRQFLLDYIEKIVYWNDKVELHGSVPVKLKVYEGKENNTELAKIEFCIKDIIPRLDRMGKNKSS